MTVNFGGDTINPDDDQSVEVATTSHVNAGDQAIVSMVGASGTGKLPIVIGVVGGGDKEHVKQVKLNQHFLANDDGAFVTTQDTDGSTSPTASYNKLTADGMEVVDSNSKSVASFGAETRIGEESNSHLKMDAVSLNLYDKDGNPYFSAGDLRQTDGYIHYSESITNLIMSLIEGMVQNFPAIASAIGSAMVNLLAAILTHLPEILQAGIEIIGQLAAGLITAIPDIIASIPQIISSIGDTFSQYDWGSIGSNILKGIGDGISNAVSDLMGAAIKACGKLVDGIKSFFGIASPSTLMANEVGKFIPAGIAEGIKNNLSTIKGAMTSVYGLINGVSGSDISLYRNNSSIVPAGAQLALQGAGGQTINLYVDGIKYNTDDYIDSSIDGFVKTMVRKSKMYSER